MFCYLPRNWVLPSAIAAGGAMAGQIALAMDEASPGRYDPNQTVD
ncbi:MAG: hypothetical protein AAF409_11400 [Pseudomonadota bacterium]